MSNGTNRALHLFRNETTGEEFVVISGLPTPAVEDDHQDEGFIRTLTEELPATFNLADWPLDRPLRVTN